MVVRRSALALAALAAALVALAALPGLARGAVRTAVIVDPRDGRVTAEGQPSSADLARVQVAYDTAGRVSLTADFHTDVTALSTERAYAWSLRFSLGRPNPLQAGACIPVVQGHAQIAATNGVTIANRLAIANTDGYLEFEPSFLHPPAVAGSRLALTAASPVLARRDLRCVRVTVAAREYAPEQDETATYDEPCDCWYIGVTDDSTPLTWFPGLKPKPKPGAPAAPGGGGKADGRRPSVARVSVRTVRCGVVVGLRSLAPVDGPGAQTARWGAFVVRADGPVRRVTRAPLTGQSLSRALATATIRGLRAGVYTVRAHYAGDAKRQPSPPVIRRVRVLC